MGEMKHKYHEGTKAGEKFYSPEALKRRGRVVGARRGLQGESQLEGSSRVSPRRQMNCSSNRRTGQTT